ncbi:hypothetical protein HPB47_012113, partial [Ixodes persulcatus]
SWDRDGSPDLVPTPDTHPSAYRNDADGSVASATEDIVMEARLLDDPFSTPDDPSGLLEEHPCLLDDPSGLLNGPSGVSSGTFLDRTGKRVDLCDASRDECDLLGLNDMDTIPEEETSSATSELSTETSHLESDRSELGDLSSSESPVPRETGDDVSDTRMKRFEHASAAKNPLIVPAAYTVWIARRLGSGAVPYTGARTLGEKVGEGFERRRWPAPWSSASPVHRGRQIVRQMRPEPALPPFPTNAYNNLADFIVECPY